MVKRQSSAKGLLRICVTFLSMSTVSGLLSTCRRGWVTSWRQTQPTVGVARCMSNLQWIQRQRGHKVRSERPPSLVNFQSPYRSMSLFMSAGDDDDNDDSASTKTVESTWNVPGLKKEVNRLILRCHKKVGKANQKLANAQAIVDRLTGDPDATLEELEQCPNIDAIAQELKELQDRLRGLNELESNLQSIKKKTAVLEADTASLALTLGVDDKPPARPPRGPTKQKGPRTSEKSRLPYRRYYSFDNIEIRVGKKAEDNDLLTLSPKHRDNADWWMHAAGCPGSHVVIRCTDNEGPPAEVVQDAASLAARQSKCQGSVRKVSMTRCRDIVKPPGAKAGLVMLNGKVRTIVVNMKDAEKRFERLEETVLVN